MLCDSCLKKDKEVALKRDRDYVPEKGLDYLLRKYECTVCGVTVYMSTGRKYLGTKEVFVEQYMAGTAPPDPNAKPVRPTKKPPAPTTPVKLPEPVPAWVS